MRTPIMPKTPEDIRILQGPYWDGTYIRIDDPLTGITYILVESYSGDKEIVTPQDFLIGPSSRLDNTFGTIETDELQYGIYLPVILQ